MDRRSGFWWSPDSKYLAFTEVDASGVPLYRIMHLGKPQLGGDAQEDHAYPFAGMSNVKVRLGIVPSAGGDVVWADLHCAGPNQGMDDEEYLARVTWMPDNSLTAQVLNRSHSQLKLLKFDIRTGCRKIILVEENQTWINLHDCFTPLQKGFDMLSGGFIWASERTGFRHLYLYDCNGVCLSPLTEGDWMVEQIAGVDEVSRQVFFIGTLDSPLETHLYSTKLFPDPSLPLVKPKKLTQGEGRHAVVLDHQMKRFVDMHDSLHTPPRVVLCSLEDGKVLIPLYEQPTPTPRARKLQLCAPDIVEITTPDATILYGALYKPDAKLFGPPPYKTLVSVYGGPNVQSVYNTWMNTVDLRAQYLRSKGILVWKVRVKT
jgi:dipeptidyl-peptidase-4